MAKKKNKRGSIWARPKYKMVVRNKDEKYYAVEIPFLVPSQVEGGTDREKQDRRALAIATDIVSFFQRNFNDSEELETPEPPELAIERVRESLGDDAVELLEFVDQDVKDEASWKVFGLDGKEIGGGLVMKRHLSKRDILDILANHPKYYAGTAAKIHEFAIN